MEKKFDLAERTKKFGEEIVRFCRNIKKDPVTLPLINQLIRCGTSIGANYCEADNAESKKDFRHKIGICKKESRETKYFLALFFIAAPESGNEAMRLHKEAGELTLIFNSIYNKVG